MGALAFLASGWGAVASGLGQAAAFVRTSKAAQWLIVGLVALFTYRRAIEDTKKTVRNEERSKIREKIRNSNEEARLRVKQAEDRVTADLNRDSLRNITKTDSDNRGRSRGD